MSSINFDIGSRVIVKFEGQSWNKPVVIGFESHPKRVYLKIRLVWNNDGSVVNLNNYQVEFINFYKFYDPEKGEVVCWDLTCTFDQRTQLWEIILEVYYNI